MRAIGIPTHTEEAGGRLATDIVALSALPARWGGAPPERIADDVAAALYHLSANLRFVGVILLLPPAKPAEARRPERATFAGWPPRDDSPPLVTAENEAVLPIGLMGRHGEIRLVGPPGASLGRERLLGTMAANQVEAACRALDLERDVAQAHEKLAALGRLGALGQLVAGVAHEVRTPLTYATNNLFLLELTLRRHSREAADAVRSHVNELQGALDRINAIVLQLRRFAKQPVAAQLEEDMRDLVRDALRLWRATHAGAGDVRERLAPTPPVLVDRGQLQQVLLNLVENAADAVGPAGTVTVTSADDDTHAVLIVEDDGPGMTPEEQERLFQPFHTTKHEGLGLGLSIVRGIVEAHHGSIRILSEVGRGTRVEVRVPRAAPGAVGQ